MNIKCIIGLHKWAKLMGVENMGDGRFMQRYKCDVCGKVKRKVG